MLTCVFFSFLGRCTISDFCRFCCDLTLERIILRCDLVFLEMLGIIRLLLCVMGDFGLISLIMNDASAFFWDLVEKELVVAIICVIWERV